MKTVKDTCKGNIALVNDEHGLQFFSFAFKIDKQFFPPSGRRQVEVHLCPMGKQEWYDVPLH